MSESIYFLGTNCCKICGNSVDKYDRDAHQEWHERNARPAFQGVLARLREVLDAD